MGRAFHFPLQMRGKKTFCMLRGCCAPRRRHLYSAPRGEARRGSRRSLPRPPRRRAGGGARVAPAPCALGAVYSVAVCLSMGGAQQASIQAARRPSTLAGVSLARGKVAAEDFVSGRASPTCPWRPRRSKPLAVLDPGYN